MPSLQNVSYNSSRVQRAYRINNIETLKLNNKIQLLEKERLHNQRLTNQDIRLISLTLDYIQTCSGHSAEGLAPDVIWEEDEEKESHRGPTFLYGERIVSRKKRRNMRPQSAMEKTSSRLGSETASTVSTTELALRPQSSPNRRKPAFVTHLKDDESVFSSSNESARSGFSTPSERFKPAWMDEPVPDVTKILLRAANNNNRRESVFNRTRAGPRESSSLRGLRKSSLGLPTVRSAEDQPQSHSPERGSRITDILNRGPKTTMSASAWKAHLSHAQTGPVSSSSQKQYVLETKKAMNNTRTEVLRGRVKKFVEDSE
ncbi:uncharacterized protein LOC132720999 [Ruditapes philippinarum]|jgi:hypothetical protein|uniref:uncharacterized protein LOC132720999 n=1 Tax=Ruditapes philippinarum TaxID=129788 RepID=UPI00295AB0F4|nr:uncharacterized protein LOC132720999 [Ruditapes philippinarum]